MVSKRGIKANPDKIKAILDMEPPRSIKDVRKLTGRVATFFSFFKALKKVKDFAWTDESQEAFEDMKKYMVQAPLLAKPILNKTLYLYLAVSENSLSVVLVKEELKIQKPIYYVSKILHGVELNYSTIENFALALHIPREENAKADALSKFASSEVEESSGSVYFRVLKTRRIDIKLVTPIGLGESWIDPIKAHIQTGWLPNDVKEARKLAVRTPRYGIPRILVTDNGTQFNNEEFRKYCEENEIEPRFTSVAHPQANGQAEVANRIIFDGLKKRIEKSRNKWVDEILSILWAYRTTCRVTIGATPFMLAYGAESVVPVEISHSSPRIQAYNVEENEEEQRLALDLIDEVRDKSQAKIEKYQKKASFYYNLRVK
ncbi:uncharacterized protein LOC141684996 [Apium graveolens]|uniref:uncharacterized protein LOC141684996 n=1 Tax=Apium graveolens TaxID=4045 RepID=UPI003D79087C